MRFVTVLLLTLAFSGCVYSDSDRATELANATPTAPRPTVDPEVTPDPDATPGENPTESEIEAPAPTPGSTPGWVVVANVAANVNVRTGAGTDNPVLTRAPLGVTLATTGAQAEVNGAIWVEVETEDGAGWVHGDFVAPTVQPTPTPLTTPTPLATPTPSATGDNLIVDAPLGLRLRVDPGVDGAVIRTIEDGSIVSPTGETLEDDEGRDWVEIRDGADTGWVAAAFLKSP